jgi:cell division protein FtsI/penicillin-binding protein 2
VNCANEMSWSVGRGSAAPALNEGALAEMGLEPLKVAAKTGSADLRRASADGDERVLKHTWLATWFPAHEPRFVLVVFCYQTYATSGSSSIWLGRQFLLHPTVKAWLREEGLVR